MSSALTVHAISAGTATSTPSGGSSGTHGPVVISGHGAGWFIVALIALFLLVGVVVVLEQYFSDSRGKHAGDFFSPSVTRSWMALSVLGAIIVLAGASFLVDDETSRATLLGAAAATLGSVTAYYFATKQGENAIAAAAGNASTTVPDLTGMTYAQAQTLAGGTNFAVHLDSTSAGDLASAEVKSQQPAGGSTAPAASTITVTLGAP